MRDRQDGKVIDRSRERIHAKQWIDYPLLVPISPVAQGLLRKSTSRSTW
jgi:hypothetical protein